jgi:hypothetical protein
MPLYINDLSNNELSPLLSSYDLSNNNLSPLLSSSYESSENESSENDLSNNDSSNNDSSSLLSSSYESSENDLSENYIINPIFNVSHSLILPSINNSSTTSDDDIMTMNPVFNLYQSNNIEIPPSNTNSNLEINNTNFPPLLISSTLGNLNLSPINVNYNYQEIPLPDELSEMEEGKIKKQKTNIFIFSFFYTGKKVNKIII